MDIITLCKDRAKESLDYFLAVLSFVPEDKLHWSPTPTAKSAFQILAHCAGYSGAFAEIIRTARFPGTGEEFRKRVYAEIESITTLEEGIAMLQKGIEDSIAALDTVRPELVDSEIESPQGSTPFIFFLTLPALHIEGHTSQIDYLQTCWDDQVVHGV